MKKLIAMWGILFLISCAHYRVNYRPILERVNETTYSDANAVYVFDSTFFEVKPTGEYVSRSHKLIKLLTDEGIKRFSKATFAYMKGYGTVRIKSAYVITPDGLRKKVPKENIKDMPMPAFEGSKIFIPNVRLLPLLSRVLRRVLP